MAQKKIASPLMVRLDAESRAYLVQAAALRHVSISDYVRMVIVPQARKEVRADRERVLALSPEEQITFWQALDAPVELTSAQRRLAALMRGEE